MKTLWRRLFPLALILCGLAATPASAATELPWAKVTMLTGGWTVPLLAVQTSATFSNPNSCPNTGLYVVPPDAASHQLFSSMLLTAYSRGDDVKLVIDGCSGWPVIIGIQIRPAA
ncbi:hypothetical protein DMC25_03200 [Caulobacter sp. D4A]|uniref:hypothetical protein n=1 Tax=unclassified Caulobacter TaxID=2648921 RepID=UPI000D72B449|nr:MULTISPECIES: hypothetical protein [unclassified Caulobacter]PXA93212.1 hypothetical protein DMC18_09455 [Caulobacter sp. D5]PXA93732.1 hypothetical protein DMC25_03200 [Caulobacter sp. D4A]